MIIHDVLNVSYHDSQWCVTVGDANMITDDIMVSGENHVLTVVGNDVVVEAIEFENAK